MLEEELRAVVPNLALGLSDLRLDYLIFRRREPTTIPAEERDAAIAELRQMGVEIQSSAHPGNVQRAVIVDLRRTMGNRPKTMVPQLLSLMSKARGIEESIEVLAQSGVGQEKWTA